MKFLQVSAARLLLMVMLVGAPDTSWAQETNDSRTYGTTDVIVHRLSAWAFTGFAAADNAVAQATTKSTRYCSGTCTFVAPLMLPAGAAIEALQLNACNNHPGFFITVRLLRKPVSTALGGDADTFALASGNFPPLSGDGCGFLPLVFAPVIVDNANNAYFIQVFLVGGDERTRFIAVDVIHRLQVSPAPPTATFNDVPTNHIFFQFIEALAAAGITGGCGVNPPRYCPDDFVTRGQMAAFISKALGLHFAP